jgi:hypothetical protein
MSDKPPIYDLDKLMRNHRPGDTIQLKDGTYYTRFGVVLKSGQRLIGAPEHKSVVAWHPAWYWKCARRIYQWLMQSWPVGVRSGARGCLICMICYDTRTY